MFVIVKNKELFDYTWDKIISDEIINHTELNLEYLENFNPEFILNEDLYLFFLHDKEGIIGKIILAHTNRLSDFGITDKLPHLGLILKDIDYHINGDSPIHDDTEAFEEMTHQFYQNVLDTALSISHNLHFENIISISDHSDDHEDLTYWGDFNFSNFIETNKYVLGILNTNDQLKDISSLETNIKFISNVLVH